MYWATAESGKAVLYTPAISQYELKEQLVMTSLSVSMISRLICAHAVSNFAPTRTTSASFTARLRLANWYFIRWCSRWQCRHWHWYYSFQHWLPEPFRLLMSHLCFAESAWDRICVNLMLAILKVLCHTLQCPQCKTFHEALSINTKQYFMSLFTCDEQQIYTM